MALQIGKEGEMAIVLRVRDDGSVVVEKFADKADKAGEKASGSWKKIGTAATLAATAIGAAVLVQINRSLQYADALSELSKRTGISTRSTQELQFAFTQSGASGEAYNAVMGRFVQTLGEAAGGSREAVDALRRVGITQDDLRRQSVEELYVRTSSALAGMTSTAERATVANGIFGRSYKDAANAINLSRKELEELRKQANVTGAVLDDQVVKNAKKTKDEMEQWSRVISVQLTEAFVALGPILVITASFIADVAKMTRFALQQIGVVDRISLTDQRDHLLAQWKDVNERLLNLQKSESEGLNLLVVRALEERRAKIEEDLAANNELFRKQEELHKKGGGAGPAASRITEPNEQKNKELDGSLRGRLEIVKLSFLTEQEQQTAHLAEQQRIIQEAWVYEQIGFEERNRLLQEANLQHQAKMGDISAQGALARRNFDQMTLRQQTQTVLAEMLTMTNGVAQSNKTMFRINQVAGIANAIINAHQGASRTMGAYPYPINVALAALSWAAGLAQVNAIRSATFGAGTSAPSIGAGGAVPTTSAVDFGSPGGASTPPNEIVPFMNQAYGNGADIRVTSG